MGPLEPAAPPNASARHACLQGHHQAYGVHAPTPASQDAGAVAKADSKCTSQPNFIWGPAAKALFPAELTAAARQDYGH